MKTIVFKNGSEIKIEDAQANLIAKSMESLALYGHSEYYERSSIVNIKDDKKETIFLIDTDNILYIK